MRPFFLPLLLLAAFSSCRQPVSTGLYTPTQSGASRAEREAVDQEAAVRGAVEGLIAADNNGNADLVASFYSEDAVLLPPQDAPLVGRTVIRNHYVNVFSRNTMTVTARSDETLVFGDVAIDRGTVTGTLQPRDGATVALNDQYLMVLKRDTAGRWKVYRLMWGPAAAALKLPG
jgi:uncharacterized protein (TIGR02246 family)